MKITDLEFEILKAIDLSEYGEHLTDDIWFFSVEDNASDKITKSNISGLVGSLVKKGLVSVCDAGTEDHTIAMTASGAGGYVGRNGGSQKTYNRGDQ